MSWLIVILAGLQSAVTKDLGATKAKELRISVLRLALKGKILHDERVITKKDVWLLAGQLAVHSECT